MKHTIYSSKLANGGALHLIDIPDSSLVEARIYFDAGFEHFSADMHQVPHLLEHLLVANGGKYNTEQKLLHAIQDLGANINATTDYQHVTVLLRAPEKNFLAALQIVFDCVFNTEITQDALDREREIVIREIHEQFDGMGMRIVNDMLGKVFTTMIPGNWERYIEDTAGYSLGMVQKAYDSFIKPNRMRVQIAGKIDASARSTITAMFEALPVDASTATPPTYDVNLDEAGLTPATIDMDGSAGLTMVFFSPISTDETAKQRSAYSLANQLLFDAPSAILPLQLRHQGVVYSITTDYISLTDWRVVVVNVLTDSDKAPLAVAEIIRYLHLYGNGHIPQKELDSVKRYADSLVSLSTETVGDVIDWYSGDILRDYTFTSVETELLHIKELQMTDIAAAVRALFIDAKLYGVVAVDDADAWVGYASELPGKINSGTTEKEITEIIAQESTHIASMREVAKSQLVGLGWAFYWLLSFVVWLSVLWISQLPIKGESGTISVFDYAWGHNVAWGLCFFVPFIVGGALTWVRGSKERIAEYAAVVLYFLAGIVYAYGIYKYFGDIGIESQPWYEDAVSIIQPLFFYIVAPLGLIGVAKRFIQARQRSPKT